MGFIVDFHGLVKEFFNPERLSTLIRLALLFVVGLPLVFLIGKWLKASLSKKLSPQQGMIFSKLVIYSGIAVIAFSVLNEVGFKFSHLLGAAGILGIAIGFASQTSVSNIISGLFLLSERPFASGDVIDIGGITGTVMSIDLLSVKLRTFDNRFVRVPNETLIKSTFINVTRHPIRRLDLTFGVAYKEDIGRVLAILRDVADRNPWCLDEPEPVIQFVGFGPSELQVFFGVWFARDDFMRLRGTIVRQIKERLDREGIEIPFPHQALYAGQATAPFPIRIVGDAGGSADQRPPTPAGAPRSA